MASTVGRCRRVGGRDGDWRALNLVTVWLCWLCLVRVSMATQDQDLFVFTSADDIHTSISGDEAVYHEPDMPQAVDLNYCSGDFRIYWISLYRGRIRRGNPGGGNIEDVISDDVVLPRGIAVDYKGNNIYFSQQTLIRGDGRLEVVTCSGLHRRILRTGLADPGPLALDITRGYLYYADGVEIYRIDTDGSNNMRIQWSGTVTGLAVDTTQNLLYWSHNGIVQSRNLSGDSVSNVDTVDSKPHGLSVRNGVLYWTHVGNISDNVPGAIYSLDTSDASSIPKRLHSSTVVHPLDISTSPTGGDDISGEGCATNNGNCPQFCFSVPSGEGTAPKCGCTTVPDQFLLYGRILSNKTSQISMVSLDTDSHIPFPVPFQVSGLGGYFVAYDLSSHMVYWNEEDPPAIKRAPIDSSGAVEVFIGTDIRYVSGLAIDPFSHNLYWCDSVLDRIEVVYIGTDTRSGFTNGRRVRKVLVSDNVRQPQSLALDLKGRYMYWVDRDVNGARIERAKLDGSNRDVFPKDLDNPTHLLPEPTYLTVDPVTGIVYWFDAEKEGQINNENTARHGIKGAGYAVGADYVFGLTILDDVIYWTNGLNGHIDTATIQEDGVLSLRGTFLDNVPGIQGLVAVNGSAHVENPCGLNHDVHDCSHICLPVNDTVRVCACPDGLQFADGSSEKCLDSAGYVHAVVFIPSDSKTYLEVWDRKVEERWKYKGGVETPVVAIAIHILDNITSMVYYISADDWLIYRRSWNAATLTLSAVATPIITCCLAKPEDLAVDWLGDNLYWTDSERGVIEVSRLDGGARRVLYLDLDQPSVLELDPRRGHIYFLSKGSTSIQYLRMDGSSSAASFLCKPCTVASLTNITAVTALSIDFDPSPQFDDRLVWSYSHSIGTVSGSFNLSDLSQPNVLVHRSESVPYSVTSAFNHSLYYFKEYSGIERDTSTTVLGVDDETICDFAIAHPSKQPGFHECGSPEICSGDKPLCLVQDHIRGKCKCPIDAFMIKEKDANKIERDSCIKTESFLLWATSSSIYYYPLPSNLTKPMMTSEPNVVPRRYYGNVSAMTYDPMNGSVVWLDGDTQLLHSVSIRGMESEILGRFPNHVRPESMTMDWIGGQIFFTESSGYQIEAASVRSNGDETLAIGSVMSSYGVDSGPVTPHQPKDVLFDEKNIAIMWHEQGRQIFKMILGTNRGKISILKFDEKRSIAYLSFDPAFGYIYWWNTAAHTIEGLNITTEGDDGSRVTTFVEGVSNASGLASNTLISKTSFIFWYDQTDGVFYRCDVAKKLENQDYQCREKQVEWPWLISGEKMVAMTSFDRSRVSNSIPSICRGGKQCDYLCVERGNQAECKCPLFRQGVTEGESQCEDVKCATFHTSCEDGLECFPNTYACDGIEHCTNGFDEKNCSICDDPSALPCGPGDDGLCYQNTSRCDDSVDCSMSHSDELVCCDDMEFGCYSLLGERYMCYQEQMMCGPVQLCHDNRDQEDCPSSAPPTDSPTPSPSNSDRISSVTIATVTTGTAIAAFILVVIIIMSLRCISKQKGRRRVRLPTISKASSSPPPNPRSDISSIISGMSSLGTESTNFGNCSSPHTDSFGKSMGFHPEQSTHISNPPPSLITRRQSQILEEEEGRSYAQSFVTSEADPCPPPNPSVDWENMSALSYSASQRGMRLPTMNGGHSENFHRRPMIGHRHHPQAGNPLHYQQHPATVGFHGNSHVYHGNGHPYGNRAGSITNNSVASGNSRRVQPHYPLSVMVRGHGGITHGGYGGAGGNYDTAETETVFSQSTINTENDSQGVFVYDDRTPPGRPPSPATITEYSERERRAPLTPTSRISEYSEDELQDQV